MPGAAAGGVGTGDQPAVGEELARRGEGADPVDLGIDGEGVDLAQGGNPEQPLDVGVGSLPPPPPLAAAYADWQWELVSDYPVASSTYRLRHSDHGLRFLKLEEMFLSE
jgi:hypothetical protein